jgi:hypothetical protein
MSPKKFISSRLSIFSDASRGTYVSRNKEMKALGDDLFKNSNGISAFAVDKKNIASDSKRVATDVRKILHLNYQL